MIILNEVFQSFLVILGICLALVSLAGTVPTPMFRLAALAVPVQRKVLITPCPTTPH